jgi:hypothetical protein
MTRRRRVYYFAIVFVVTVFYFLRRTDKLSIKTKRDDYVGSQTTSPIQTGLHQQSTKPPAEDVTNCVSDYLELPPEVLQNCPNRSLDCGRLTCRNLLRSGGGGDIYDLAANFSKSFPRRSQSSDLVLVAETADCAAYRKYRGFREISLPETEDFPIAFNVLVHRGAHQVARLLRAIYRPNNVYCLHVDSKSSDNFRSAMTSLTRCFDNIRFASRLETIVWAGFNRLQVGFTYL